MFNIKQKNKKTNIEINHNYSRLKEYIDAKINENMLAYSKEVKHYVDNFKWFNTTLTSALGILIAGSYFSFSLERSQIEKFKEDTKKELLGELTEEAEIRIKGQNGKLLKG